MMIQLEQALRTPTRIGVTVTRSSSGTQAASEFENKHDKAIGRLSDWFIKPKKFKINHSKCG